MAKICKVCGKVLKGIPGAFMHLMIKHPLMYLKVRMMGEEKMSKLIISKDGKLVKAEDVQNEQVIEETKKPVFKKEEAAPVVEVPTPEVIQTVSSQRIEPAVEFPETPAVEEVQQVIQPQYPQTQQQPQFVQQPRSVVPPQVNEAYMQEQQHAAYIQQQREQMEKEQRQQEYFMQQKEEEMRQRQAEAYNRQQRQAVEPKTIKFIILLNNKLQIPFNIPAEEADNFYTHVENALLSGKVLKLENKLIPAASVAFIYFE